MLTVDLLKPAKAELEDDIKRLIIGFQEKTNLTVTSIEIIPARIQIDMPNVVVKNRDELSIKTIIKL